MLLMTIADVPAKAALMNCHQYNGKDVPHVDTKPIRYIIYLSTAIITIFIHLGARWQRLY